MRILDWFDSGEAVTMASLERLQSEVGHVFPKDCADFILKYSGANNPSECSFTIVEEDGSTFVSNFGAVLHVDGDGAESILGVTRSLSEQHLRNVVAIVDTGFGDYVCLHFSEAGDSLVVYYSHERPIESALLPLAPTFTGFLDLLEVPADE